MKKILTTLAVLLTFITSFAASNTLNYQAIVRNADGTLAKNANVGVRFRILDTNSQALYTEEITVTTDESGLFNCAVGANGNLMTIPWDNDGMKLEVSLDLNGGQNYSATYISDINSVATALYAAHSGDTAKIYAELDKNKAELSDLRYNQDKNLQEVYYQLAESENKVNELAAMMDKYFPQFMTIDERIKMLEDRIAENTEHLKSLDERNLYLEARVAENTEHMKYLDERNMALEARMEEYVKMLDSRIMSLMDEIVRLTKEVEDLKNNK